MKNSISLGSWITVGSYNLTEVLADCGFDWLCIDIEHTSIDYSKMEQMILTIQSKGIKAYVRVGENSELIIKRALDSGADGIIIPSINNEEDAKKAVNYIKYPPFGKRGVGLSRAQGYGFNFDNYKNKFVKSIKIILQIEHIDAINNLEKIINVDGVDGTLIGPYDLSASLGNPGDWKNQKVIDALKKYEQVNSRYNKLVGYHVIEPNYELVLEKIRQGYNFIAFSLDTIILGTFAREQVKRIKK